VIGAEERESGFHRVPRAEQRRVTVEHPEIVDGAPAQASKRGSVFGIVASASELIEPATDAARAEGNHRAQVMRDDDQLGMTVERPGNYQPTHSDEGLQRPT